MPPFPMNKDETLFKILKSCQVLPEQAEPGVLKDSTTGPIRALARLHLLDEAVALRALSEKLGVPLLDTEDPSVADNIDVTPFIPSVDPNYLWQHKIVPLYLSEGKAVVACANPLDHDAVQGMQFALQYPIDLMLSEESKILRAIAHYFPNAGMKFDLLHDLESPQSVEIIHGAAREEDLDHQDISAPPIVRLCNKIISDAVREDASDIHIEPFPNILEVRYRIDGSMQNIMSIPRHLQGHIISRLKILAGMDIAERRKPQDGRMRVRIAGESIDMRVSSVPTAGGEKIVLRLLRSATQDLTFTALGIPEQVANALVRSLNRCGKMLLVTGPTGSGKTTTLYAALSYCHNGTNNIETVEDPIEYRIEGVNQIQVNTNAGVTFASALRSILRQDPDVVMIGEIRDSETATIAMQAAQTGHLVLSTLHTNDAVSSISRLSHLGADPLTLSASLGGILAQRLVRRLCPHCKGQGVTENDSLTQEILVRYNLEPGTLWSPVGCPRCRGIGYRGRIGIYSYLEITPQIASLIGSGATHDQILRAATQEGYQSLSQAACALITAGLTTLMEAKSYLLYNDDVPFSDGPARQEDVYSQPQTLVIIDSDESFAENLSALFLSHNMAVYVAGEIADGLVAVEKFSPDVLICDADLALDHPELQAVIQSRAVDTRALPVIVLRSLDSHSSEKDLCTHGVNTILPKTCSSRHLMRRIEELWKASRA